VVLGSGRKLRSSGLLDQITAAVILAKEVPGLVVVFSASPASGYK
jgi:hypothetical protein